MIGVVESPGDAPRPLRARAVAAYLPATEGPAAETVRLPDLDLERLPQRVQGEPVADLFAARAVDEPHRDESPPTPPASPQAPPLPFTFMGKLIEADQITVFLTNGTRNWVVRTGDTIDGAYRVEAISEDRMTLTHLALQLPQALVIGERTMRLDARPMASTVEALPATTPASASLPGQVPLLFTAPSRATAGAELIVRLALPGGSAARQARVELAYDPTALAAVDAPTPDAGRIVVELGAAAPLAQLRFKVIAVSSTSARIGIERAVATDASGRNLSLATPDAHSVQVVAAGS